MKKSFIPLIAIATIYAVPASATTIIDLPPNMVNGNCVFNTNCGPTIKGAGTSTFAAQLFTLTALTSITNGTFTVYSNSNAQPSALNWMFLAADGAGSLPGTLLASGSSSITTRTNIGAQFGYELIRTGFDLSGVNLGAGNYYFGLQAVSNEFPIYLAYANGTGAAQTNNGGASWSANYEDTQAVSVSLESLAPAVPEPATWLMMILGFGMIGAAARRRPAKVQVNYSFS